MFWKRLFHELTICCLVGLLGVPCGVYAEETVESLDIAPVWSGHPVGFCLLTDGNDQFVAFYDADRKMTVGQRKLDSREWRLFRLPEQLGWDSHNSVTMALDSTGRIHLSGNMHCAPLVYFWTREPRDLSTFERLPGMIGRDETRATYPHFFTGPGGALVFTYRDGKSGSGNQIYNVYDVSTQTWRRLLDTPLTDGQGRMNAYFHGPLVGPDGYYHMCWVWRDTPDCATNHDLSYARSRDLVHWEKSNGEPLALPITIETAEIVDAVPPGGGIINGNNTLGFDSQKRPILAYHKYDADGKTQVFTARLENGKWVIRQTSRWDYRWEFSGGGSIPFEVRVETVHYSTEKGLTMGFSHPKEGAGTWTLEENDLVVTQTNAKEKSEPQSLSKVQSNFPGMTVRWANDLGSCGKPGTSYRLRWETLGPNRDRPREPPWPEPGMLQVIQINK